MSVLFHDDIINQLEIGDKDPVNGLIVTPLLDRNRQVGPNSIDVRLGNEFIVLKQSSLGSLDLTNPGMMREVDVYQDRIRVNFHEPFILHPKQLVLGSTLEYVSIPTDLIAEVLGRSSLGRLGLIIETAPVVAPGFKGCITLELANIGEIPLILYPGIIVAQLMFVRGSSHATYEGRYNCPTGPQFSRFNKDTDIEFWGTQKQRGIS